MERAFVVRAARAEEHEALGRLMVSVYSSLEGFPGPDQQPKYYEMLANIGQLAGRPSTELLVAAAGDALLGGVVYFADMKQYGSGVLTIPDERTSGFRLLAVGPAARGLGVGRALVEHCVARARAAGHGQVIIHSTHAMKIAWGMYERLGFRASSDLDFMQGTLQVFGFRLAL